MKIAAVVAHAACYAGETVHCFRNIVWVTEAAARLAP
jgi:hypothetical protein